MNKKTCVSRLCGQRNDCKMKRKFDECGDNIQSISILT